MNRPLMQPSFKQPTIRHGLPLKAALLIALVSGCGLTGYGPAMPPDGSLSLASQITPRTKGGTLNITPQSKGGTLKGSIVWPAEVAALASKRFIIKVFAGSELLAEGATDAEARFVLNQVPPDTELRLEAHVPGRPNVILRSLVQTPAAPADGSAPALSQDLSMLSTAAAAVLTEARTQGSSLGKVAPARLLASDATPLLTPLAKLMTPYLDASLSVPIENLAPVRTAIDQARIELEKLLAHPLP